MRQGIIPLLFGLIFPRRLPDPACGKPGLPLVSKTMASLLPPRYLSFRHLSFVLPLVILLTLFLSFPSLAAMETGETAGPPARVAAPILPVLLQGDLVWREIAPGLESLELQLGKQKQGSDSATTLSVAPAPAGSRGNLVILRTDPAKCEYSLHMASENRQRRSLRACADDFGLDAAINAGMFLPDNLKNTGYMRNATHVNNPRIVANFGAFFLAEPVKKKLPRAVLAEKNELGDKLEQKIADYSIAVQNYRLTNARGEILWPESSESYSISALARDKRGRVMFVAAEYQLSAPDFARVLLLLPLETDLIMYLEGGTQAGLVIRDTGREPGETNSWRIWRGRHGLLSGLGGPEEVELPNVLGVRSLARP